MHFPAGIHRGASRSKGATQKRGTEVPRGSINFVLHMYKQLTREQRYAIYLGVQEKKTQAAIARQIGVNKSTVSRELKRNSNRHHGYWWSIAHERATDRRGRTVRNRETSPSVLREARRLLLTEEWSPRQISGWLKKKGVSISHERIYEMIREDGSESCVSTAGTG